MNKKEIINNIKEQTEFLFDFGYNKRKEKNQMWAYTLSYLSKNREFAIEFELDCRDVDLFVLVTILDDGYLPKGYYVNNKKRVRIHIEKLYEAEKIKTGNWKEVTKLRKELKGEYENRVPLLLNAYCKLIKDGINDINCLNINEL